MGADYSFEKRPFLTKGRLIAYGAIVVLSSAVGVREALADTGYITRAAEIVAPILSAYIGARTETKEAEVSLGDVETFEGGLVDAFAKGVGAVTGAGLSGLCQLAGAGLTNLAQMLF